MKIKDRQKIFNKIAGLKAKSLQIFERLNSVVLKDEFEEDHISHNCNTIDDYQRIIDRIGSCSESIHTQNSVDGKNFKIVEKNSCGIHTICPICASNRRNKIMGQISPYLKTLQKMSDIKFYMVTFTIKNVNTPGEGYEKIRSSFTKFIKLGQKRKNANSSGGEANKILGYVLAVETVESSTDDSRYHSHAHALIVCRKRLDYQVYNRQRRAELERKYGKGQIPREELDQTAERFLKNGKPASKIQIEWEKATEGNGTNIQVDPLFEGKKNKKGEPMTLEKQLYEVIKYETKPMDIEDPKKLLNIWDSTQGKRRISKGGLFTMRNITNWMLLLDEYNLEQFFWNVFYKKETEYSHDFNTDIQKISMVEDEAWGDTKPVFEDSLIKYKNDAELLLKRQYQVKALNVYMQGLNLLKKEFKQTMMPPKVFIKTKQFVYNKFKTMSIFITNNFAKIQHTAPQKLIFGERLGLHDADNQIMFWVNGFVDSVKKKLYEISEFNPLKIDTSSQE